MQEDSEASSVTVANCEVTTLQYVRMLLRLRCETTTQALYCFGEFPILPFTRLRTFSASSYRNIFKI